VREELEEIGHEMQLAGLLQGHVDFTGMVDDRFARGVEPEEVQSLAGIFPGR
jgi:hypothetical protein